MPNTLLILLIPFAAWCFVIAWWRLWMMPRLRRLPSDDLVTQAVIFTARIYARVFHRLRVTGLEYVPHDREPGPLIVIANHTGPLDPVLLQCVCPFMIRWMMARETMLPALNWMWERIHIIPVERHGRDTGPTREAMRHVRKGGVLGIFPEGGIADPPGVILPFFEGVGGIVARTKAPVLIAWIHGTPTTGDIGEAFRTPSHAHIHFVSLRDFSDEDNPERITHELRRLIAKASGWPLAEGKAIAKFADEQSRHVGT